MLPGSSGAPPGCRGDHSFPSDCWPEFSEIPADPDDNWELSQSPDQSEHSVTMNQPIRRQYSHLTIARQHGAIVWIARVPLVWFTMNEDNDWHPAGRHRVLHLRCVDVEVETVLALVMKIVKQFLKIVSATLGHEPQRFLFVWEIRDDLGTDWTKLHHSPHLTLLPRPGTNDLTIGWQNLNLPSHPNATLAPQTRQARPSGETLNYLLSF